MPRTENAPVCKCFFIPGFMWQITLDAVSKGAAYRAGIWYIKIPWPGL